MTSVQRSGFISSKTVRYILIIAILAIAFSVSFMIRSQGAQVGFEESRPVANASDLKDATSYDRERWGKREFKGGSPLYVGKGGTIVAREGLLNSLKQKFGKDLENQSILNEEIILEEDE